MAKSKVKKMNSTRAAQSVETQIVEMSLQNPELGARRLVPMLKKKRISVSAATIQNILRRHGLQNREKRLEQVNKRAIKAPKLKPLFKKPATRITDEVAERIAKISLQNPDFGARRLLPLLKKKRIRIPASTVNAVLKRHGLQSRAARMAKLEQQNRVAREPESPPKKALPKITDDVAERICAKSLQIPDLGAKNLAPLLKELGISVSSSTVYRILKHHELHTRTKRFAKAAEFSSDSVIIPKTFSEKIPPEVEKHIVEISLQNPEYGARGLLPLLQQEEIFVSISTAYRILKRNNLENRQKRLLKLEARLDLEAVVEAEAEGPELFTEKAEKEPAAAGDELTEAVSEPEIATQTSPGDQALVPADMPEPEPESAAVAPAVRERRPLRKALAKPIKRRSHPAFYPLYFLLFVLIGYLGFHGFQAIQYARSETVTVSTAKFAPAGIAAKVESSASERPLEGYRRIWERNLFNIARAGDSETEKQIAIEEVVLAEKDLGLKLVGTVMADDAGLRRAFIDNSKTRRQKAYHEGDAVGGVRIKKILRNRVIVGTAEGDRLLMVGIGGATEGGDSESLNSTRYAQQIPAGVQYPQQVAGRRLPGLSFKLSHEEVLASLADIDKLEQQLNIAPFVKDDQPAGFKIGNIPPDSILRKMGLKSGNAIMGVNDETITGPEQAAEFFKTLAQGGEKTVKARIGRGVRSRTRYFHLIIE